MSISQIFALEGIEKLIHTSGSVKKVFKFDSNTHEIEIIAEKIIPKELVNTIFFAYAEKVDTKAQYLNKVSTSPEKISILNRDELTDLEGLQKAAKTRFEELKIQHKILLVNLRSKGMT